MEENGSRAEAERLLGIAEKFLQSRDLASSKDFAVLAQETAPLLDGSDLILAISDVLLAADKRINNHPNWYAILQIDARSDDLDFLKKQYRRLALLLHPDKNKFPFANEAFQLVADAWAVLSDPAKKSVFDNEMCLYSRVDLMAMKKQKQFHSQETQTDYHNKLPVRKQQKLSSFWTACPYCYNLYEYPRVYQDCCLKCNNCGRAMHAAEIPALPPVVQGRILIIAVGDFFRWALRQRMAEEGRGNPGFNWMPPLFGNMEGGMGAGEANGDAEEEDDFVDVFAGNRNQSGNVTPVHKPGAKKRGRPRKNV